MPLTWTDKFSTNSDEIDKHHQTIINQLNHLQEQMVQGKGKEEIGKTLEFLESYAKMHFEEEEKLMEKYNCPVAALNKDQHAIFLQKVADFRNRYESASKDILLTIDVQHELSDWIINHILKVDVKIKDYIN